MLFGRPALLRCSFATALLRLVRRVSSDHCSLVLAMGLLMWSTACSTKPDSIPAAALSIRNGFWELQQDSQKRMWYPDGQLYQKMELLDGQRHGLWQVFNHGGQLTAQGNTRSGLRDGEWRFYYGDGRLFLILNYASQPRKDEYLFISGFTIGNENGIYRRYYPDQSLEEQGSYQGGILSGPLRHYYPNGQLAWRGEFSQDLKSGLWEFYYPDGRLRRRAPYKAGKLDGELINYDRQGRVLNRTLYRKGTKSDSV
ncbi:MAG: toxin-antitoxin system YwqK family antitoxin [Leptospiraceae bacterium]|nr:toxin-antitoxin system YwqK family antitoxin [Leptospiraceae bacterium]